MRVYTVLIGALALVALMVTGCSNSNPVAPASPAYQSDASSTEPVQFAARVATTDQNQRMLTFEGRPDVVVALQNAEIVRLNGSEEAPIPFGQIHMGDSVEVNGNREANGYVFAYQLRVIGGGAYDLAFRDTIATIDYAAGTFTVLNRSEVIVTDEATVIWVNEARQGDPHREVFEHQWRFANSASEGEGYHYTMTATELVFTDLKEGDVVEIRANIVDESTLLAARIKLALCSLNEPRCVTFEATIATLDVDTRTVTFDGLDWVGVVCNKAMLTDADGVPITLADFAVGDLVAVKGFPLEDGTLKICMMTKVSESTLMAARVQQRGFGSVPGPHSVLFEATIATLDLDTRAVTFSDADWVGVVCDGALLTDADGVPITLEDFAVGDLVSVKGHLLDDGTLRIGTMTKA